MGAKVAFFRLAAGITSIQEAVHIKLHLMAFKWFHHAKVGGLEENGLQLISNIGANMFCIIQSNFLRIAPVTTRDRLPSVWA
jgi:hypothetical protein